jgi:beta-galactosidase
MLDYTKLDKILYGGDYNPEQWPEETWPEDMRMFRLAGIDILTLNVFSWAAIQPSEDCYDFSRLDRIVELAEKNGIRICMATSTGAHPAWMAMRHPDILRTDEHGIRRKFGSRHNSCPNSPTYLKYGPALAGALAQHYRGRESIVAWHISNEYSGECYCENCEKAFRDWLKEKYGTIEAVNAAWDTAFWGHTFYGFEEIVVPDYRSEMFEGGHTTFQGISLDYRRFMSDSMLRECLLEADEIRSAVPDAVITTNFMALYKGLDYAKWAKHLDVVALDCYPSNGDPWTRTSMTHDQMRGLKNGDPYMLMEQTPSVTNWQPYNALKRPGVLRLLSWQAVAHGADTVMFFQMKQSIGACEKYHGAVISHAGSEDTRVFREIAALGTELKDLGARTLGSRTAASAAVLFDWDNWWAIENSAGPSTDIRYLTEVGRMYSALRSMNYDVDLVAPDQPLDTYRLVCAPLWYMVKGRDDENVRRYVAGGGTFVTSFFSGIVQENDLVTTGGYPGKLRDILGIWVEENDALPSGSQNSFRYGGREYPAGILCDILHLRGAQQIDEGGYTGDFYKGSPVVTVNHFGKGRAYYIATASGPEFYRSFLGDLCREQGMEPVMEVPADVEATCRRKEGARFVFLLNHKAEAVKVRIPWDCAELLKGGTYPAGSEIGLAGYDVRIFEIPDGSAGCQQV